jgi:hypothetical protein
MQLLSLARGTMIRNSLTLATSQPAANHPHGGLIPAAQGAQKRGCGSFRQTAFHHEDALDLDWRDESSLFDHLLVLSSMQPSMRPSMQRSIPTSTALFNYPIGLSISGLPVLGQQLKERDRWQRSGRYGCNTVPRQD